jgi:hypothetical protein
MTTSNGLKKQLLKALMERWRQLYYRDLTQLKQIYRN